MATGTQLRPVFFANRSARATFHLLLDEVPVSLIADTEAREIESRRSDRLRVGFALQSVLSGVECLDDQRWQSFPKRRTDHAEASGRNLLELDLVSRDRSSPVFAGGESTPFPNARRLPRQAAPLVCSKISTTTLLASASTQASGVPDAPALS